MREEPLRHEVVRLHSAGDIPLMDAHRDPHEHMLDAFHNHAIDSGGVAKASEKFKV